MPARNNNNEDLNTIIQTLITPLISQLKELDSKVDKLNENYVTRSDLEKMIVSLVPKELYETRHSALIARDVELEQKIKAARFEMDASQQKLHERLESGKQQFEDRQKDMQREFEKQFEKQKETLLSNKDRVWIRWSQAVSAFAMIIAIIEFLSQHIKFN